MSSERYLLELPPARALLRLSIPMIVGHLFQQLYYMIDSVVCGQVLGETALAAVGACNAVTQVFLCLAIGGAVGASMITAHCFGAGEKTDVLTSVSTALIAFLAAGAGLSAVGLCGSRALLTALATPEAVLPPAVEYLSVFFAGLPLLVLYNIVNAEFNALGRSRIPLVFLIVSSVLNIGMDFLFVAGLGMGVAGAAWATVLSQGLAAVPSLCILLRQLRPFRRPGIRAPLVSRVLAGRMLKLALPSMLQQSVVSVGMMLVQSVVNTFGAGALAGYSYAIRIEHIAIVPHNALGNALSSYTAQNLGGGSTERVAKGYRAAMLMSLVFNLVLGIGIALGSGLIARLFLGDRPDPEALAVGSGYLCFVAPLFFLNACKTLSDSVLRGAGDMPVFTIANFVNLFIRMASAYLLSPIVGIRAVWYAIPVGWLVNFAMSYAEYRTGRWKRTMG